MCLVSGRGRLGWGVWDESGALLLLSVVRGLLCVLCVRSEGVSRGVFGCEVNQGHPRSPPPSLASAGGPVGNPSVSSAKKSVSAPTMSSLTERYSAFASIGKELDAAGVDEGAAQSSTSSASVAGALDGSSIGTDVLQKLQNLASVVKRASELVSGSVGREGGRER